MFYNIPERFFVFSKVPHNHIAEVYGVTLSLFCMMQDKLAFSHSDAQKVFYARKFSVIFLKYRINKGFVKFYVRYSMHVYSLFALHFCLKDSSGAGFSILKIFQVGKIGYNV